MTGYVRKDTTNNIADGNVINAADLDSEFDGVQDAFNASTGHKHDGTAGEGATINALGPTQDVTVSATLVAPKTTNTVDIGSSALKFKDLFLAGNGSVGGTLAVTGVATLGAGAILNTPASVTLTNATGLPIATGVSGLGTGVATFLATPSSANLASAITDETGSGALVFATSPTLVTPALGTPSSGVVTNLTGTASININGTVGATTATTGAFTTLAASGATSFTGSVTIFNSATNTLSLQKSGGAASILFGSNTAANGQITSVASGGLFFSTGDITQTEKMRITADGSVGIGTSSPAVKLDVYGAQQDAANTGNIRSIDTGTLGANKGGGVLFGGYYTGTTPTAWAAISGLKNNATDGDYGGYLAFKSRANGGSLAENMRLDSAGVLGLGVTPAAWGSSIGKTLQINTGGSFSADLANAYFAANSYYNGTNWIYQTSTHATRYTLGSNFHAWYTAPTGTAGNAITFTQAMTLDASGNLLVGTTSGSGLGVSNRAVLVNNQSTRSVIAIQNTSASGYSSIETYNSAGSQTGAMGYGNASVAVTGAQDAVYLYSASAITFLSGGTTERMRLDTSGNLGLGVTPSVNSLSGSGYRMFELSTTKGSGLLAGAGDLFSLTNTYFDGGFKYANNGYASQYVQSGGSHIFYIAPSGTAGAAMSRTQAMTLDASGNFMLGATSARGGARVTIDGTNDASSQISLYRSDSATRSVFGTNFIGTFSNSAFEFYTNSNLQATISTSGNFGLGVTPSAWGSGYKAFEFGNDSAKTGALFSNGANDTWVVSNTYFNGSTFIYKATGTATGYEQAAGQHRFYSAASGTAGTTASLTQAMTLDASGNLLVGTTSAPNTNAKVRSSTGIQYNNTVMFDVSSPNGKVFTITGGSNGQSTFVEIEIMTYQGYFKAMHFCINSSGSWENDTYNQVTSGTAPTVTVAGSGTATITLTVACTTSFSPIMRVAMGSSYASMA